MSVNISYKQTISEYKSHIKLQMHQQQINKIH